MGRKAKFKEPDPIARDVFGHSRNAMCKALMDAGVDPLITGTVLVNFEEMGFFMLQLDSRLRRLEAPHMSSVGASNVGKDVGNVTTLKPTV